MSTAQDGFADNWNYLRSELGWLDQVLLAAVARHRKQQKETDRLAQTRADRATSHWWKGIVSLEGNPAYDEYRKPNNAKPQKLGFQQQMDARIQLSRKKGVSLGLPLLRDRLGLSVFEKNAILIGLAPEINRRYARLYRYLKGDDDTPDSDLPSVDLVLRLLCRNDQEWAIARRSFSPDAALIREGVVELYTCTPDTRLKSILRLTEPCVDFLLSSHPSVEQLEAILYPHPLGGGYSPPVSPWMTQIASTTTWEDLVLPRETLTALQAMTQRIQAQATVDHTWGFDQIPGTATQPGLMGWLEGASGTGKTMAARAIAHALAKPLSVVDLQQVDLDDAENLIADLGVQQPTVLLLKSAECWFGRTSEIKRASLHQWLAQRHQVPSLTLLSTQKPETISQHWKSLGYPVFEFPIPKERDRLQLWQRAFPESTPVDDRISWRWLAKSFGISGGEIQAIARDAALYAAAAQETVSMSHLLQALTQRGHAIKSPPPKARRSRRQPSV